MDPRSTSVRAPLVPEPVLLVPEGAVIADGDLGADRGGSGGAPDGGDSDGSKVLEGYEVRVHAEPREVQREGARADHDLRELRCSERLRDSLRERR